MTAPQQVEALLRETRWLSGLAKQLVSQREDAEDLVQETLRAAWEHPPASGGSVRGWLRAIMLHRWRDVLRARRARAARERSVFSGVDEPATADVVAKAEIHRGLVGTVLELDEPYRTCVLLRFFENLPPREIARQTGVPVATVHSRLQRALKKMRDRLTATHGSGWARSLAPLLPRNPFVSLLLGVSIVSVIAKVALGLLAITMVVLCWDWSGEDPPAASHTASSDEDPPSADASKAVVAGPESVGERTVDATEAMERPEDVPVSMLRGRVIDVFGAGVPGVSLSLGDGGADLVSSSPSSGAPSPREVGAFEFSTASRGVITSTDPRWATVLAGATRVRAPHLSTVVVAPRIELGGRVVDSDGNPLSGARVQGHLPAHLGADLGIVLDYSVGVKWEAISDQDGRFVLSDVPAVAKAQLSATLGGYVPRMVEWPTRSMQSLELVLERPKAGVGVIDGFVVDPSGAFVADARVSAGGQVSRTDDRGAFTIDVSSGKTLHRIVAVAQGMQPAVLVPERDAGGRSEWPARVVLRLGQAPLSITGRVIDRNRQPVEGAKVWIADPLVVGFDGKSTLLAENYLARRGDDFWAFVRTDRSGQFRLDGLRDRSYTVQALDPSTFVAVTQNDVPAGRGTVELQLNSATYPELRGRVLAQDGTGVSSVSVSLTRHALSVPIPGHPNSSMFKWETSAPVTTNQAGEFSLSEVSIEGVTVTVSGDTILPAFESIEPGIDPMAFDVHVDRRVHLQVELVPPTDRADAVRILDATGRAMLLVVMRGGSRTNNFEFAILDGRSQVLTLGEGAQTAVFLKAGKEIGRQPVRLQAGQLNTIRF